jgi:hypothetical protein
MSEEDLEQQKPQERKGVRAITLSVPDDTYKRLLIKIRHENLNWKRFFGFLIEGFIDDDPGIMNYIDAKMADVRIKGRSKILKKERKEFQQTIEVFGLDENEIHDIYDILEEEFDP